MSEEVKGEMEREREGRAPRNQNPKALYWWGAKTYQVIL